MARRPRERAEIEERHRKFQAEYNRQREQERLDAEAGRQWNDEQERFDAFYEDVTRWDKAARIRAYLLAFTQEHERRHGSVMPGSVADGWLRWLHDYADELDPLVNWERQNEQPGEPTPKY